MCTFGNSVQSINHNRLAKFVTVLMKLFWIPVQKISQGSFLGPTSFPNILRGQEAKSNEYAFLGMSHSEMITPADVVPVLVVNIGSILAADIRLMLAL